MATTTTSRVPGSPSESLTKRVSSAGITETTTKRVTSAAADASTKRVLTAGATADSLGLGAWGASWGGVGTKDYSWGNTWRTGVAGVTAIPLISATKRVVSAITASLTKRITDNVT
jgi:hypothetical protein